MGIVLPVDRLGSDPGSALAMDSQHGRSARPQASIPGFAASGLSPGISLRIALEFSTSHKFQHEGSGMYIGHNHWWGKS